MLIVSVSVVLIAALMGWLFMQGRGRDAARLTAADSAAMTEGGPVASTGAPPSQVVTSEVFEPNVKSYVDQVIELTDARYQASLSTQTFWVELPSGAPFLVKLAVAG